MAEDLSYMWLEGEDLSGINFSNSTMRTMNLDNTNLSAAILYYAELDYTWMNNATLTGAVLVQADLTRVQLDGANLDGADLRDAWLPGTSLVGASLVGANLSRVDCQSSTYGAASFVLADLTGASFVDANLGSDCCGADDLVHFDNAIMVGVDFTGVWFASSYTTYFDGADLTCAIIPASILTGKLLSWTGATCPDGTLADGDGCLGQLDITGCP